MAEERADDRVYIGELSRLIDRRVNTVRGWERAERIPANLRSQRRRNKDGSLGWRYWSTEQVTGIVQWMKDEQMFPGSGLTNFKPDAARIEEMISGLRAKKIAA